MLRVQLSVLDEYTGYRSHNSQGRVQQADGRVGGVDDCGVCGTEGGVHVDLRLCLGESALVGE